MYDESYQVVDMAQAGSDTMLGVFSWFIILAVYLYFSFMMSRIAYKCGCGEQRWWAFIPVMNTLLLIKMAEKPTWWFFLLLIPVVNIIAFFILWMTAAKNAGQSAFWGFMVLVPLINFIAIFVLAYNNKGYSQPTAPSQPGHAPSDDGYKPPQPSEPTYPRSPQKVE